MDDNILTRVLNTFAARIVFLECQLIALQRLLDKAGIVDEAEYDAMVAKAVEASKEVLGPKKDTSERLAAFLRKYEGPIQ